MSVHRWCVPFVLVLCVLLAATAAEGRPPIRADFFGVYPGAVGSRLDDLPSNTKHCGACHFDFNGGGPRNPYGLAIEIGRNNGLTTAQAVLAVENEDADSDGKTNLVEITSVLYTNTPTFPGLSASNVSSTLNIPLAEINPYLTPMGSIDMTPPAVAVISPNGGESWAPNGIHTVSYSATDASGVASVSINLSDDGGATWKPMLVNLPPSGTASWFVPNLPGTQSRIQVVAVDNAGNAGSDLSDLDFTIEPVTTGYVPTSLRDMEMSGTQPHSGVVLADASTTCITCHGGYNPAAEPYRVWEGSMMAQAARDPLFLAAVAIAEQDAPAVGDLCIRCHSPGGWMEGRSDDTGGGMLVGKDSLGVQCDFCHRLVDYDYDASDNPPQDPAVLASISPLPLQYGNGSFIADPGPVKRGPYSDADASHEFVASPFHREANLCGTCHDVSSPVFERVEGQKYAPTGFDAPHGTLDIRDMLPIERTFSEWTQSAYAQEGGVYAPQFAGNKPDGMVSTCQDCHMRDVTARGCNVSGAPMRSDMPLHDLTGGNTFVPDLLASLYPGEVDPVILAEGKARAQNMLELAATLSVTSETYGLKARVTNETGHKLPSGYPEGRRIWLSVRAVDAAGIPVFASGAYDFATAELTHDEQAKIYEIHPGLSPGLAAALGLPAGPSFHFVLNDTVYQDNRIPPRGFTNAAFEAIQSPVVDYAYDDGQYWDDSQYFLPAAAETATVTLYYQSASKEFVTFLRDENHSNDAGDVLYNAWLGAGMSTPVVMAETTVVLNVISVGIPDGDVTSEPLRFALAPAQPNPFASGTRISFTLPEAGPARLAVYDLNGRQVRTLVDGPLEAGVRELDWDGTDDRGAPVASGIYFMRVEAGDQSRTGRLVVMR